VSVIIPTYNGARFIGDAVRSVWEQTRLPDELIVVDDGSTDETVSMVAQLRASSPMRLRLCALSENTGSPARPINEGIRMSEADMIAVLDQDDALLPTHIASLTAILETQKEVVFAACACAAWGRPSRPGHRVQSPTALSALRSAAREEPGYWLLHGREMLRVLVTRGNVLVGYPSFVFRRADWASRGGLDESFLVGSDYEMLCWLCGRGLVAFIPQRLYRRRTHAQNLSWLSGMRGMLDVGRVVVAYAEEADGPGVGRDFWRLVGRHYVRMLITLGWADRHAEALRRLGSATLEWGWTPDTHMSAAKLAYTWLIPRLVHRAFHAPADELGAYIACLDAIRGLCNDGLRRERAG
jgi:glycosyltransferase involved in cell wall biosynthesis